MINIKILIPIISWTTLGFKRGLEDYDYTYNKYSKNDSKKVYLYSTRIAIGLLGSIIYINPFFIPISVSREIYRLEVNVRGLEDQKKTDYYNELF